MAQWASAMTSVKEMHHFYPVLYYFRFTDARYSMGRTALITLEATALIRTALGRHQFGWIRRSAALEQLEGSARLLTSALPRLRHAGMDVTDDVEAGVAEYVRLREGWDVRSSDSPVFLATRRNRLTSVRDRDRRPAHRKD